MRLYNLFVLILLFASRVLASCEPDSINFCTNSSLQIGASYTYANIKIQDQKSFHGNLGGVQGLYEYKPWNSIYGGVKLLWKQGKTKNSIADRKLTYVDTQERIGYTFAPQCDNWSATLFTGLGFRFLGHRLKQHDETSVKFEYNEFYVPIGLLSQYYFSSCWSLGLNITWMPQVYPSVEITPLKGARWILKNTLGNVFLELPLRYTFDGDNRYSLILNPFYERWEDGRSTAKTANGQRLGLPKNTYNFWGLELNFGFAF